MSIVQAYDFYLPFSQAKKHQLDCVFNALSENLDFKVLEVIETGASYNLSDGCFGLFL